MQTRSRRGALFAAALVGWVIAFWVVIGPRSSTVNAAFVAPLRVPIGRGVVAADTPEAARAGAEVLARGGNAVDAAVATALALGVVSSGGSGLGGGGFLVLSTVKDHRVRVLDFRETAPAAASRDMFLVDGKFAPERSKWGGLAVAIPGEPAGLAEVEAKFGKDRKSVV